ncbi:MAG: UvrD-helicase domain-containing protein, partial [Candidatus Anammoxibacter sp.]
MPRGSASRFIMYFDVLIDWRQSFQKTGSQAEHWEPDVYNEKLMNVIPIQNCNEIDLNKHALIEASAGTGKTYTIENLVVRMLLEKEVNLENILLVTFTEKAAGELKTRIRE